MIGFAIIAILFLKGKAYLAEFFLSCDFQIKFQFFAKCHQLPFLDLLSKARNLDVFDFVGKALGLSAGIELAYMLFTDGPDEAISPLIMAVASGAFFSISNIPDGNWVIGVYCVSLVVLLYARKQYEEWESEKEAKRNKPHIKSQAMREKPEEKQPS